MLQRLTMLLSAGSLRTLRSLSLVRVNLLARHSTPASKVSMAGPGSMISESGWLAFFDSELCGVHCGDEFGLEFKVLLRPKKKSFFALDFKTMLTKH